MTEGRIALSMCDIFSLSDRPSLPPSLAPIPIQFRLEKSNKWPDEIKALRRAQTAFLLQIARG